MQPTSPRDFLKVALQRLDAAEQISSKLRLTLEAQYICGYAVECSLKALLLEKTPVADRLTLLGRFHGAAQHRAEVLLEQLRGLNIFVSVALAKRLRRFGWTTAMRYETGRKDTGETNAMLRTAKEVCLWVEGQIP